MVVDALARDLGIERWRKKDSAEQAFDAKARVVLVKPTSYMNLSGTPVRLISSWYRTPPQDVLVIVDEMDLPFGRLRLRPFGGHGGHNGLRSIIATIGDRFPRIRVGVGRPEYDGIDHVLGKFTPAEARTLPEVIGAAAQGARLWLTDGLDAASRAVNTWAAPPTDTH